ETQAASFLKKHPEYDGRGTVIAILDTGVDPGAPGLQITSDGKPKVINLIDCTGSGDVPCTTVVRATETTDENGNVKRTVTGLSGRTLVLGSQWKNPTGEYRLGFKNAYDLFPKGLVDKLKKERKEKFEIENHQLLTKAQQAALESEKSGKSSSSPSTTTTIVQTTSSSSSDGGMVTASSAASATATPPSSSSPSTGESDEDEAQLKKADLKARVELLREQMKTYEDAGIHMDCVVFHDGEKFRAAIDINETGDLTAVPLLTNFWDEHQYVRFGDDSMLNFSVNIYDNGEMLSIVTMAGSHGTHVAAISAANYPDEPKLNGVAPGAQIVSLKIGDTRLGSMETGTGLVRAAIELSRLSPPCDLANMSYGEAASIPDFGRFIDLLRDDVINKNGCIFVSSAGNAGPALTTVGAPGGTTPGVIGVGAYVHESMMDAEYSLLERVEERPYTWCSRGPALNGDIGVDIYAPGAAITSVPQYTIQHSQLMNGTSMSSPNLCGCLSLLVSALKAEGVSYNPYRVRQAIVSTAKDVKDPMQIGFIQVEKAWAHLNRLSNNANLDVFYEVTLPDLGSGTPPTRGIYLRDCDETNRVLQTAVNIQPKFMNEREPSQNFRKLAMEAKLSLVSTQPWIRAPKFLLLNNGGRAFSVRVDPTVLTPGTFHFGQILAYDTSDPDAGPLFAVPVTVCKPDTVVTSTIPPSPSSTSAVDEVEGTLENGSSSGVTNAASEDNGGVGNGGGAVSLIRYKNLKFEPGTIVRRFVAVPSEANFAELTVWSDRKDTPSRFIVHMIQLQQQTRYPKYEQEYAFMLSSTGSGGDERQQWTKYFAVIPNVTMELCLAQFWSSLGTSTVHVELKFHALHCRISSSATGSPTAGTVSGGADHFFLNSGNAGFTRVDVSAPLRREEISPGVTLDTLRKVYRPTDAQISPLKSRDVLPDSRQVNQIILTYQIKIGGTDGVGSGGGTNVTFRFPRVNDVLYDSAFENFFLIVHDASKKVIACQDIYPKSVKLTDGSYAVRVQVLSHSIDNLDRLMNMPLLLDVSLSKSVSLSVYRSLGNLLTGTEGAPKKKILGRGESLTFFLSGVEGSALPKDAKAGDLLLGRMDIVGGGKKLETGPLYSVAYLVPPEIKSKDNGNGSGAAPSTPPKDDMQLLNEAIRDLEISWLKKFKSDDQRRELLERLEKQHSKHLPLLQQKLDILVEKLEKKASAATTSTAVKAGTSQSEGAAAAEKSAAPTSDVGLKSLTEEIVRAADAILALVDTKELAVYYGTKHDLSKEKEKQLKKESDKQKEAVVAAFLAKAKALKELIDYYQARPEEQGVSTTATSTEQKQDQEQQKKGEEKPSDQTDAKKEGTTPEPLPSDVAQLKSAFDSALSKLANWIQDPPTNDGSYLLLWAWRQRQKGLFGTALKAVNKYLSDPKNSPDFASGEASSVWKKLVALKKELIVDLGWELWRKYEEKWVLINNPKDYAPF
ncbi:tripeptidyl-peptidase II Tpp2, partial [Quaeritorhiza haematococci]